MHTIYTIGYTGLKLSDLTVWMDAHNATLVDTRLNAYSPNPDWKKHTLQRVFSDSYRHVKELGNVNYKGGGDIALKDVAFGVEVVRQLLEFTPVLMLCTCSNVDTCHRKVAAEAVSAATGAPVIHLTPAQVKLDILKLDSADALTPPADWDTPSAQLPASEVQHALPGFGAPDKLIPPTQLKLL